MVPSSGSKLKERILVAAREVLNREGPAALSTRRIAGLVGVSATSLYLHFDSKDALLHALVEEGVQSLGRVLKAARDAAPPGQALPGMARAYVDFGLAHPQEYELMFVSGSGLMERYPAEKYRSAREVLADLAAVLIEEGRAGSDLGPDRALVEATALWSSLHGLVALLLAERIDRRIDIHDLINTALARALSSHPGAAPLAQSSNLESP